MTPIPTEWWLRPVSKAARVGAHSAVVWKRLYLRPFAARRSAVGVAHGPPNALAPAKPTSSSKMTSTLGAPAGGCNGSIGGNFASGSFAPTGTAPPYSRSRIGRTSLWIWEGLKLVPPFRAAESDAPAPDAAGCDGGRPDGGPRNGRRAR